MRWNDMRAGGNLHLDEAGVPGILSPSVSAFKADRLGWRFGVDKGDTAAMVNNYPSASFVSGLPRHIYI